MERKKGTVEDLVLAVTDTDEWARQNPAPLGLFYAIFDAIGTGTVHQTHHVPTFYKIHDMYDGWYVPGYGTFFYYKGPFDTYDEAYNLARQNFHDLPDASEHQNLISPQDLVALSNILRGNPVLAPETETQGPTVEPMPTEPLYTYQEPSPPEPLTDGQVLRIAQRVYEIGKRSYNTRLSNKEVVELRAMLPNHSSHQQQVTWQMRDSTGTNGSECRRIYDRVAVAAHQTRTKKEIIRNRKFRITEGNKSIDRRVDKIADTNPGPAQEKAFRDLYLKMASVAALKGDIDTYGRFIQTAARHGKVTQRMLKSTLCYDLKEYH